jgi:hypothetical protein
VQPPVPWTAAELPVSASTRRAAPRRRSKKPKTKSRRGRGKRR